MNYIDCIEKVALNDVTELREKDKEYGGSWKKRGGANAFFMLCRKWDRIEQFVEKHDWDIFKAIKKDERPEGILDDIRDLRRYLLLVEAEMVARRENVDQHPLDLTGTR